LNLATREPRYKESSIYSLFWPVPIYFWWYFKESPIYGTP
jgi:hypothetical protein